uniref:Cytochrome P450, family 2, subfamily AE, polypeptide 1 n=1 Tax=Electrophorus electricus TaxID=8005 RepID=A0A4W4E3E5_ELEEL
LLVTGMWLNAKFILVFLCVTVLLVKYLRANRAQNTPPGPCPLPVIGNLLSLSFRDPVGSFTKVFEHYGDVSMLYLGNQPCILLSGYKSFKEAFVEKADIFADRAHYPLNDRLSRGLGLISSSGRKWAQHRRFTLAVLKDFGMGKQSLEHSILQENRYLCEALLAHRGQVMADTSLGIPVRPVPRPCFRYTSVVSYRAVSATMSYTEFPTLMSWFLSKIKHFSQEEIDRHRRDRNTDCPRDYIDCYLQEIQEDIQAQFTEENLLCCVVDLFAAGTETTSNNLLWSMLYMATYPTVQESVHAEIDQVIGWRHEPSMADRALMPYTYAVVHEVLRSANALNITPPRVTNRDPILAGYFIPKVSLNQWCEVYSGGGGGKEFRTPDQFNPGHFLDENGKFLKKERFIPFSIGKRTCPGEQMVQMELFLFFTCLMRFSFHPPDGQNLDLAGTVGITTANKPFHIRALPR